MVDTHVSGACRAICGGSSPPIDIYFTLFTLTYKGTFTISEPVFAKQICKPQSTYSLLNRHIFTLFNAAIKAQAIISIINMDRNNVKVCVVSLHNKTTQILITEIVFFNVTTVYLHIFIIEGNNSEYFSNST